ncbi:hypothetical protein, partial [Escherichia coli]|uniref:hypothetical protein n=2 Tax=Bacteria TaxID=2 RepID=UPI0013D4C41A
PEPVAPDITAIVKRASAAKRTGTKAAPKRKPKGGGAGGVTVPVEPKRPSGSVPKVPLKTE